MTRQLVSEVSPASNQNDAVINQTIISDKNDMPLYESLQFDLYARYDHYSAFLSIIISKI